MYTNKLGFNKVFPCSNETSEETSHTLRGFIKLVGLPPKLHSENHKKFKKVISSNSSKSLESSKHIQSLNCLIRTDLNLQYLRSSNTQRRLFLRWILQFTSVFFHKYTADIIFLCDTDRSEFMGWAPYETVIIYTPDISEYATSSWFQWSWLFDESLKINLLCRWSGPDHEFGQEFSLTS